MTPDFGEGEALALPMEVEIDITMDGEHYVACEEKYYIYDNEIVPTAIFPKSASIEGGTRLELDMPLSGIPDSHLFHIVVRFTNKTKRFPYTGDLLSRLNLEDVGNEYMLVDGRAEEGKVVCEVPKLVDTSELTFLVDVAVNSQQYTG